MNLERVITFMDCSNLFHVCKSYDKDFKIDYIKFKEIPTGDHYPIHPYFYASFDSTDPKNADRQKNSLDSSEGRVTK